MVRRQTVGDADYFYNIKLVSDEASRSRAEC